MEPTGFDHERLLAFASRATAEFAENHRDQTFYGFSVDATLLCLNSEEQFAGTLAGYLEPRPDSHRSAEEVLDLKMNTGNWACQGFADLGDSGGFDRQADDDHYDADDVEQKTTPYGLAMDRLVAALVEQDSFAGLKRTGDFFADRVEHRY